MAKPVLIGCIFGGFLINLSLAQLYFSNEPTDVPNYGQCITPNSESGFCILLKYCKYLSNILTKSPLSDENILHLSRSLCGYENGKVLICCPNSRHLPQPGQCGNVLSNRNVGGNVTKIDEFPWMALIEHTEENGDKSHRCDGALINTRYVITASQCVNGRQHDFHVTGVRLGEWDTSTNPDCEVDTRGHENCAPPYVDVPVERAIPHPQYNPKGLSRPNDIALLRLAREVPYTDFIRPICLPTNANLRSSTFEGIVMDEAGWGVRQTGSGSTLKQKVAVDGYKFDDCVKAYSKQNINLEPSQMCAGSKAGIDSCLGISGGPLISLDTSNKARVYYFLAGVVSFGPTSCGLWPGVYTRVGNFMDWIEQTVDS